MHKRIKGSYAVVALIAGYGLLAFRDPFGIRPLIYGTAETPDGPERDRRQRERGARRHRPPGRARRRARARRCSSTRTATCTRKQCAENPTLNPCMFEYVYLARPDSVIDGISVYQARLNMGETLAQRLISTMPPSDIDVVIPIPESSRPVGDAARAEDRQAVPRRLRQEPLRRPHLHHAGAGACARSRCARSSTRSASSSRAATCCWSTTPSCAARRPRRSCRWRARPARNKVYMASAAPPVRTPTCTASTCPRPRS